MRIVIVGGSGLIGNAVAEALSGQHEVVRVGQTRGGFQVNMASRESIERLFETLAPFDAVISAAGQARFGPLDALTDEDFHFSLTNKLMGQVNLVRIGLGYIADSGSFTLTTGVLAQEPMKGSAAISLVNAGVEGFVRAAALEMSRGVRINAVSPPWVSETLVAMGRDGSGGIPAARVARAYVEAVNSRRSGEILDARDF